MSEMTRRICVVLGFAFLGYASAWSQQTIRDVPAVIVAYPDLIVYNAKIYSMDDHSLNASYGSTYQAMAVRGDQIQFLGTNDQVLSLAGPKTRKIDVKGRAVLPGFIDTHNHLHDGGLARWAKNNPETVATIYKSFSVAGKTYQELTRGVELVLKEHMSHPLPGQWAVVEITQPGAAFGGIAVPFLRDGTMTRAKLDKMAPTAPVALLATPGGGTWLLNTAARDNFLKFYEVEPTDKNEKEAITLSTVFGRSLVTDYYFDTHMKELANVIEDTLQHQAAGGFTTYSSHIVGLRKMPAFMQLVREGRMPIRFAFSHRYCQQVEPDEAGCFLRMGDWAGLGDKYFWNVGLTLGGIDAGPPTICTTADSAPEFKKMGYCIVEPGSNYWKAVYAAFRSRYRYVVNHLYADKGLDYIMDLMDQVMKENPDITLDFMRSQRITSDHCAMYPRQDQIPRLKRLNMVLSCNPNYINGVMPWLKVYGAETANRISPVASLIKGGVVVSSEYEGLQLGSGEGPTPTTYLYKFISRINDNGDPVSKQEAIDRVSAMKMTTVWAAYYTLKEKEIGSLEVGKFADFVVFNKDYFTIPEKEIPTSYALMTVLGGKTVSLREEYAQELGTQPVGPQIKFAFETHEDLNVNVTASKPMD